ncbi:MAG: hypothetical protein WHS38_07945 [Thermodesulforhabdaceae bacterium]
MRSLVENPYSHRAAHSPITGYLPRGRLARYLRQNIHGSIYIGIHYKAG